jgi:hypothetical protein
MNNLVTRVRPSTQNLTRPAMAQYRLRTFKPHSPLNLSAVAAPIVLSDRFLRAVAEKRAVLDILGPVSPIHTPIESTKNKHIAYPQPMSPQ